MDKEQMSPQQRILRAMRQGVYQDADRLPPEVELASEMRISRTQLRDALAQLEREGFITRRHGVGTLINRHVLSLPDRMDLEVEFSAMIEHGGHKADVAFSRREVRTAEDWVCRRLNISENASVLCVSRVLTSDGKPAIYCDDMIPCKLIRNYDYPEDAYRLPIFDYLRRCCGQEPHLDLTQLRPVAADNYTSYMLQVKEGTPLLRLEEVDYNIDGVPILLALQYFVDGPVQHWILRKRF